MIDQPTDEQSIDEYPLVDRDARPWLRSIEEAEKIASEWNEQCEAIDKLYADAKRFGGVARAREMQIFWANMEVLKPSIYSRRPVPVVVPRFRDRAPLKRHAAEILERCLVSAFEADQFDEAIRAARDDMAIAGRGVVWVRFDTSTGVERIAFEHVDRVDFLHQPARKWTEVEWVARRTYLTREQMQARFGAGAADKVEYSARRGGEEDEEDLGATRKASVWEIWSRRHSAVVWVAPGTEEILDAKPPFLRLEGFYPCPCPAFGVLHRRSLRPVPEYLFYKDQIEEINQLTARISALSDALRIRGFYAGGSEDISVAVESAFMRTDDRAVLTPIANMAALGAANLASAVVWMPIEAVSRAISDMVLLRRQLIQDVYEITGISDIMRGSTDAGETLGAQQLKSQYGSVRIRERQEEIVRLARDLARIAGEIIAENFSPETIKTMSQYGDVPTAQAVEQQIAQIQQQAFAALQSPQGRQMLATNPEQVQQIAGQVEQQIGQLRTQPTFEAVVQLLQNERLRPFILDIETDSTIQPDENAAKQRTTEFLAALAQALAQLSPMVGAQPETAPFAGAVLKFAVSPFRASREIDGAIDEFVDQIKQISGQPKPNPEADKAKADIEAKSADIQLKRESAGLEAQKTAAEIEKIRAETMRIQAQIEAALTPRSDPYAAEQFPA